MSVAMRRQSKGIFFQEVVGELEEAGWVGGEAGPEHPSFKATLTGLRKTRLRKVQICPRLAETKRKNIFLDHMNSRFCLGSSRYWLHKFDQNTTKTASFVRLTLRAGAVKF